MISLSTNVYCSFSYIFIIRISAAGRISIPILKTGITQTIIEHGHRLKMMRIVIKGEHLKDAMNVVHLVLHMKKEI